ncbi:hypothetical protein C1T28_09410 [Bacillus subtilis]|nr:hypothetical protein C1T25_18035 [Bacillus cereus]POO74488.1 hypothetical protein C1T28_09410 [Bacillus subtilis]
MLTSLSQRGSACQLRPSLGLAGKFFFIERLVFSVDKTSLVKYLNIYKMLPIYELKGGWSFPY